jgi:hypothetical protein
MNNATTREVVDRILALVRAKTAKSNPTSDDIDLRSMFYQVHGEHPDLAADEVSRAFGIAHDEIIEQHHRMQAAKPGTVH